MKKTFVLLSAFFPFLSALAVVPGMQTPSDIRTEYGKLERDLLEMISSVDTNTPMDLYSATDSAGYIRATNAIPFLFNHLTFGYEQTKFSRNKPKWVIIGARSLHPLPPSWAAGALNNIPFPWSVFLSFIGNSPLSPEEAECVAWIGLRNFPDQFTRQFVDGVAATNLNWASISNKYSLVEDDSGWRHSELTRAADVRFVRIYDSMESNLLAMATSACAEQNATNLLDVVSTYRFIHAPIPETVSTNAFFQATIGDN